MGEHLLWATASGYGVDTASVLVEADRETVATRALDPADDDVEVDDPPVVASLSVAPGVIARSGTAGALVSATDPEGGALGYAWSATGGFVVTPGTPVSGATITAPAGAAASGTLTVEVSDGTSTVAASALLRTADNAKPAIASITASPAT